MTLASSQARQASPRSIATSADTRAKPSRDCISISLCTSIPGRQRAHEFVGTVGVASPQGEPELHPLQVHAEAGRRFERQRRIEQLLGPVELAQRQQRFDRVGREHDAGGALHAAMTGLRDSRLGDLDRVAIAAEHVHGVGGVDRVPQERPGIGSREFAGGFEVGEALLDVAPVDAGDAAHRSRDRSCATPRRRSPPRWRASTSRSPRRSALRASGGRRPRRGAACAGCRPDRPARRSSASCNSSTEPGRLRLARYWALSRSNRARRVGSEALRIVESQIRERERPFAVARVAKRRRGARQQLGAAAAGDGLRRRRPCPRARGPGRPSPRRCGTRRSGALPPSPPAW